MSYLDLRLNDIDPGNHLGYCVLDLSAWVHLDEVEVVALFVQQEFDRSRTNVVRRTADLEGRVAKSYTGHRIKIGRWCRLDYLLITPLD